MSTLLELHDIECRYGGDAAVAGFSCTIDEGELCCLIGPSGCGKTTVLRAIAGFEPLHAGRIVFAGRVLSAAGRRVPPEERDIGLVFQDYALFPHMTVRANVGFGLHRLALAKRRRAVDELLDLVRLRGEAQRYPHELSGGQQQRTALARALATRPRLLLLDEPFSNLDAGLRRELNLELKGVLEARRTAALLVTHDQEESFAFAAHMGLLWAGKLQQWDTPYNLYHRPVNRFVARFIGQGCFLPGQVEEDGRVQTELGRFPITDHAPGAAVEVLVRPDDILYDQRGELACKVSERIFSGDRMLYTLRLPSGSEIRALMPSHLDFPVGQEIGIRPDLEHLIAFPRGTAETAGAPSAPGRGS